MFKPTLSACFEREEADPLFMDTVTPKKQDPLDCSSASRLKSGCSHCLSQCEFLLSVLSAQDYSQSREGASSVGCHVRHILDRFHCFFNGMVTNTIDYDARNRDRTIETSLSSAQFAAASIANRVNRLADNEILDQKIKVSETVHPNGDSIEIMSSVERELMSLITHSVHHLALIALIAKSFGHEMGESFGKAPSTIVFERS